MELVDMRDNNRSCSITELHLPAYRRASRMKSMITEPREKEKQQNFTIEQQQLEIKKTFAKLTTMINGLDNYFKSRIRIHQQQILKIAKVQLIRMQEEVEMIISKYADMMRIKDKDQDIMRLRNQIFFYRTHLQKAQDQNNILKKINKELKEKLELKNQFLYENQEVIKKIKVKMLKEKLRTECVRVSSTEKLQNDKSIRSHLVKFSSPKVITTQIESIDTSDRKNSENVRKSQLFNYSKTQDLEGQLIQSTKQRNSKTPKVKFNNLKKVNISRGNKKWRFFSKNFNPQDDYVSSNH